jgi:signal transduction histidine kinase
MLKRIFFPHLSHPDFIIEWKLNAYNKTFLLGLFPLAIAAIICMILFKLWVMVPSMIALVSLLVISYGFIRKGWLFWSVTLIMIGTSITNYSYLLFLKKEDGLPLMVLMIIIVGIFIGTANAFIWACIQTIVLVIVSHFTLHSTFFPVSDALTTGPRALNIQNYISPMIFLYFAGALLSILFQRYFSDLLFKVKKSHDEKAVLESELVQAQKLEAIGLLAGGIAHDFGHNLTTIKSCANLILKRRDSGADIGKYAGIIQDTCNIINDSTGKLLSFAKEQNKGMTHIDIHEVIESMASLFRYMLMENIEIKTELQASHSIINGNFFQLQNVFMNLIINAQDAMPGGGVISVFTNNGPTSQSNKIIEGQADSFVFITVQDTGTGMNEAVKLKVFTPFFSTKEKNKGSGLGLFMVKRTIENHSGVIEVESEINKGTKIKLKLPLLTKS